MLPFHKALSVSTGTYQWHHGIISQLHAIMMNFTYTALHQIAISVCMHKKSYLARSYTASNLAVLCFAGLLCGSRAAHNHRSLTAAKAHAKSKLIHGLPQPTRALTHAGSRTTASSLRKDTQCKDNLDARTVQWEPVFAF